MDAYARERGWPDELLKLWWSRHLALKMPFYIRCRFEHLPFVVPLDQRRNRGSNRMCPEEAQITAILREMGIRSMLILPLHLSKGRVAMVVWAGARKASEVLDDIAGLEGDLLAVGYHFMRIACHTLGASSNARDERSRLTPREWDCARTLAQGFREVEIAEPISGDQEGYRALPSRQCGPEVRVQDAHARGRLACAARPARPDRNLGETRASRAALRRQARAPVSRARYILALWILDQLHSNAVRIGAKQPSCLEVRLIEHRSRLLQDTASMLDQALGHGVDVVDPHRQMGEAQLVPSGGALRRRRDLVGQKPGVRGSCGHAE